MQLKNLHILLFLVVGASCVQAQFNEKAFDHIIGSQEANNKLYGFNQFRNKSHFAEAESGVTFFSGVIKKQNVSFLVEVFAIGCRKRSK